MDCNVCYTSNHFHSIRRLHVLLVCLKSGHREAHLACKITALPADDVRGRTQRASRKNGTCTGELGPRSKVKVKVGLSLADNSSRLDGYTGCTVFRTYSDVARWLQLAHSTCTYTSAFPRSAWETRFLARKRCKNTCAAIARRSCLVVIFAPPRLARQLHRQTLLLSGHFGPAWFAGQLHRQLLVLLIVVYAGYILRIPGIYFRTKFTLASKNELLRCAPRTPQA